jgi:hypothetical protein
MGITVVRILINILTTDIPIFYIFLRCIIYSNFSIHDVAYVQYNQDYIGLPEDGVPDAPKHVGARCDSKYMAILKNAFSWSFFHHNLKNVLSKLQKKMYDT